MKFLFAFAILAIVLTAVYGQTDPWNEYKKKYGKNYTATEDSQRKQIFLATDALITRHNSQNNVTYTLELNNFSDMWEKELAAYLGVTEPANPVAGSNVEVESMTNRADRQVPASLVYRTHRCLPAVKNQGNCGSCWAFSAITPLEFAQCKKTGVPIVLSEQQLVDCDTKNFGCNGGWPTTAWSYVTNVAKGSAKSSVYPYIAKKSPCKYTSSMSASKISSYGTLSTLNAVNMQSALATNGPLSVAITVVNSFYSYKVGVYADPACDNKAVNHAVVVVGWGTRKIPFIGFQFPYWIVRNSWGSTWGSGGYILMQRGVNKCNIERYPATIVSVV